MRAITFAACIWILIASGTFLFTAGFLDFWESHNAQNQIAQEWQADTESDSATTMPVPAPALKTPRAVPVRNFRPGAAVAKLTIPRLDASLYVVEGTDDHDLKRGPGHLTGSVLPGEDGNCVIAGHRDTHFRMLKDIKDGDEIILERDGRTYRYRVDGMQVVTPDNTASLQPTDKAVLNLITCYPFHYIGSAPKRFIVHAGLEESALAAAR